jgi:hypothetical protein
MPASCQLHLSLLVPKQHVGAARHPPADSSLKTKPQRQGELSSRTHEFVEEKKMITVGDGADGHGHRDGKGHRSESVLPGRVDLFVFNDTIIV